MTLSESQPQSATVYLFLEDIIKSRELPIIKHHRHPWKSLPMWSLRYHHITLEINPVGGHKIGSNNLWSKLWLSSQVLQSQTFGHVSLFRMGKGGFHGVKVAILDCWKFRLWHLEKRMCSKKRLRFWQHRDFSRHVCLSGDRSLTDSRQSEGINIGVRKLSLLF